MSSEPPDPDLQVERMVEAMKRRERDAASSRLIPILLLVLLVLLFCNFLAYCWPPDQPGY